MEIRMCRLAFTTVVFLLSITLFAQSEKNFETNTTYYSTPTISVAHKLEQVMAVEDLETAIDMFEIMRSEPQKYRIVEQEMSDLAWALFANGKTDQSIAILQMNTQAFPKSFQAFENLGNAYLHIVNMDKAEKAYDKAAEIKGLNELQNEQPNLYIVKIVN